MSSKEKIQRYIQAMGYMTRAEGLTWYEKKRRVGEIEVETVDAVERVEKDVMLPPHLGNRIDMII